MAPLFNNRKFDSGPAGRELGLFGRLIKKIPYSLVIAVIISFGAYLWLSQFEPQYRAEAAILVDTEATARSSSEGVDRSMERDILTAQAQLLRSRDLARAVMQRLNVSDRSELDGGESRLSKFLVTIGLQRDPSLSSPDEQGLEAFSQALIVYPDEKSSVVTVAFISPDPQLAAAVPNALAEEYVALTRAPRGAAGANAATAAARVVTKSVVPAQPSFPQAGPAAAIIGLVTLVVLVGGALFREIAIGRRARREAPLVLPEVAELTHVAVPIRRNDSGDGAILMADEPPSLAPDFDSRGGSSIAAVAKAIVAGGINRIMIATAASTNDDLPSHVGITLARAIARADRRTVLIDLRAAANGRSLGEGAPLPGFSDLFAGEASFGQVISRDRESRVHFIPAGLRPCAQDAFSSDRIGPLVSALDHTYDHVILDVAEERVETIAPLCDVVVVVSSLVDPDPRAAAGTIDRLRAKTAARIILLTADASTVAAPANVSEIVDSKAA